MKRNIFANLSIRTKLIIINMTVSLTVLVLFGMALFFYEIYSARQFVSRELTTMAQLLGNRSTAALAFDDKQLAIENLNSLRELPNVVMACIYSADGSLFAEYVVLTENNAHCPDTFTEPVLIQQGLLGGTFMVKTSNIIQQDTLLGKIQLRSDLNQIREHMDEYVSAGIIFILVAIIMGFLLTHRLQKLISNPLITVTRIASNIEENKDYSLRAPAYGQDELGRLATAFNNMLETIEIQNLQVLNSEAHFRRLVESSEAIPWELDLDTGCFTYVGPQSIELLGYPEHQWYEKKFWSNHIYEEDRNEAILYREKFSNLGDDYDHEYRMYTSDGRLIWIREDVTVVKESNKPIRLQGFMFDITQRKRLLDAIKNIAVGVSAETGEEFFKQLVINLAGFFDAAHAFIGLFDKNKPDLIKTIAVSSYGKITDNIEYQLEGTPCGSVIGKKPCAYPSQVQQSFPKDKVLNDLGIDSYIGSSLTDSNGSPLGIIVIMDSKPMQDIELVSEILQIFAIRAAAEIERLKSDEQVRKLSLAVEQSPNTIIITDLNGNIEYVNSTFSYTTGYAYEEVIGRTPSILKSGKTPLEIYEDMWKTIRRGDTWTGELHNKTKNGGFYWDLTTISPIKDANGHTTHYLGIQSDISKRKEMEDELRQHRTKLEELIDERTTELKTSNKELESFSYSVSHDLRAPLRAIDGFSMALLEDYENKFDDIGKNFLIRIRQNTLRMSELIDGLLNLSRMGRASLKTEPIELCSIANEIMSSLQSLESDRKVEFNCNVKGKVSADVKLMYIVLENLLGNSMKYSRKTQNTIIEFGEELKNKRVFYVRDNGAGFNMKYVEKLFGVFQRLHKSTEYEGTGIGLATVQRIILKHGGEIWAESEPGKGATFYFHLGN